MSGCDVPIRSPWREMTPDQWDHAAKACREQCDCDHGEDDPCCSETEDPSDDAA